MVIRSPNLGSGSRLRGADKRSPQVALVGLGTSPRASIPPRAKLHVLNALASRRHLAEALKCGSAA